MSGDCERRTETTEGSTGQTANTNDGTRNTMTVLFCQPLLAFLDILVEKQRHVPNYESENDLREEFGGMLQLRLQR